MFAKRELVIVVIKEKRREGIVETPEILDLGESFGVDLMNIYRRSSRVKKDAIYLSTDYPP